MKLYTEEQLLQAYDLGLGLTDDEVLAEFTPIELPTWDDVRKAIEMAGMTFTDKDYSYQWTTEEIIEQLKQSKQ